MSKTASYTLLSAVILIALGGIAITAAPAVCRSARFCSGIASLAVFFSAINAISFKAHGILSARKDELLTRFYLIDKTARFLLSAALFCVLLYLDSTLATALSAFAYYIAALAIETVCFANLDKQKETGNA